MAARTHALPSPIGEDNSHRSQDRSAQIVCMRSTAAAHAIEAYSFWIKKMKYGYLMRDELREAEFGPGILYLPVATTL